MSNLQSPRRVLEDAIETLIAVLDMLDPDPDLEETGDQEPDLGWTERGPSAGGINNDCEEDKADWEDGGDDEYSLGWTSSGAHGENTDREWDDEREPENGL